MRLLFCVQATVAGACDTNATRTFMHDGRVIDEPDAELLRALAEVRDVLADDTRPEHDFYVATAKFLERLHAQLVDRGYDVPPLDVWDPRPATRPRRQARRRPLARRRPRLPDGARQS